MSAWAEASNVIDELTDVINAKGGGNQSVIIVTTTTESYFGKNVFARSGFETYQGVFEDQGNGTAKAVIYVGYISKYKVFVDNDSSTTVNIEAIGQIAETKLNAYFLYGFHVSGAITDPDAKVTPIEGCQNYEYENVQMDFDTGVINGGDWFDVDEDGVYSNLPFFFPRSCMLSYGGEVAYYLDENDETKKADGTPSEVSSTSFGGNAMMEWGQDDRIIYTKIVPDDGDDSGGSWYFSDRKLDDDFTDYAFRDLNNQRVKHFYTAKYFGSLVDGRMRSISGQSNYVNGKAPDEITYARANGTIWDTLTLAQWMLINGLLILMAGSTNTQAVYGTGRCASGNTSAIGQGTMNGKGMFYGMNDQTSGGKVFGMENWWGNIWRRIRGYINDNGTIKVKLTRGTFDGSTAQDYNTDGSGYLAISDCTPSGTSGGYTSIAKFTKYGMFPKVASGSETTHYTDGLWFNNSQSNYAFVGGDWDYAGHVGALCVALSLAPSVAGSNFGSALSCTPLAP